MPSPAIWCRQAASASSFTCAPRRSSPARSCWPRASRVSFEFARAFRNRERGPLHHPEFTLVEWYRAGEPYETLMDDCAAILALAARIAGAERFAFRGTSIDPFAPPERLTVTDAFARHAGIDLAAMLATVHPLPLRGSGACHWGARRRGRYLGRRLQPGAG